MAAVRAPLPVGIDVEAPGERLERVRRRYAGPADTPVLEQFGDNLDALCRLWTAKEAAFKVFGTGVDFLTGLEWLKIGDDKAEVRLTAQAQHLQVCWFRLDQPEAWLAVATSEPES